MTFKISSNDQRIILCHCKNTLFFLNFSSTQTTLERIPPDYAVTLLDSLMNLCHYCLLDVVSPVSIGQPSASSPASDITTPTNIFTNLWHVFNPVGNNRVNNDLFLSLDIDFEVNLKHVYNPIES